MREVWLFLAAFYGTRWTATNGEVFAEGGPVGRLWQMGLSGLSVEQIGAGLEACRERRGEWPPAIREFVDLCKPLQDHSSDWKSWVPDRAKMPSPERKQWHMDNVAWLKAGHELPRPDVIEPPPPGGFKKPWEEF